LNFLTKQGPAHSNFSLSAFCFNNLFS
jgi:hypothetical protein